MSEEHIRQIQADVAAQDEVIRLQRVAIEQQQMVMDALNRAQANQLNEQIRLMRQLAESVGEE